MHDDLLHAKASVKWAESQIPKFERRLNSWLVKNKKVFFEKQKAPATHDVVLAGTKSQLPPAFQVEAGAYINVIRSSLDILAVSLALRHGVPSYEKARFPFSTSADNFKLALKTSKLKPNLPDSEIGKIELLKPYVGGNDVLYAIHDFDIMRKHRRLLEVKVDLTALLISASVALQEDFVPTGWSVRSPDDKTVVGLVPHGKPKPDLNFAANIAFYESGTFQGEDVIKTLKIFIGLVNHIISLFDVSK